MSRHLDDLAPVFRPLAVELIARLIEADIPHKIIDTRRTQSEQDAAVASGHSQVKHSKHQDGLAIDLCPWDQYLSVGADKLLWDTSMPSSVIIWKRMGVIGKSLGLRWGGDFKPLNKLGLGWDPGHFEFIGDS
jgi:hypothetical protein